MVCACVGAGVLGLPHAMLWVGLPVGLLLLLTFYLATLWASLLLAGARDAGSPGCATYKQLVSDVLGERTALVLGVCQYVQLVLVCVGYTVTAGTSLLGVMQASCGASEPHSLLCRAEARSCILAFGAVQLALSQLPTLESAWWSSLVGAAMSFVYSGVAVWLGGAKVSAIGCADLRPLGREGGNFAAKVFGVFEALGTIAFAFSFSSVLVEIQATLEQPPPSAHSMRKAVLVAITLSGILYGAVAVTGLLALGDETPGDDSGWLLLVLCFLLLFTTSTGDILMGFPEGGILVAIANWAVVLHMVTAYQVRCFCSSPLLVRLVNIPSSHQVFAQPMFALLETSAAASQVGGALAMQCSTGEGGASEGWAFRLLIRSASVVLATLSAAAVPLFSEIISFIGALSFWLPVSERNAMQPRYPFHLTLLLFAPEHPPAVRDVHQAPTAQSCPAFGHVRRGHNLPCRMWLCGHGIRQESVVASHVTDDTFDWVARLKIVHEIIP